MEISMDQVCEDNYQPPQIETTPLTQGWIFPGFNDPMLYGRKKPDKDSPRNPYNYPWKDPVIDKPYDSVTKKSYVFIFLPNILYFLYTTPP